MNILIVGAGSIGMLLAARLDKPSVTLITRTAEQAEAIRTNGLELIAPDRQTISRHPVYSAEQYAATLQAGMCRQADAILLAVKQMHIDGKLTALLRRALKPEGIVVCYQNGIGHIERLAEQLGARRVAIAVTTEGARRISQSAVKHTGTGITRLGMSAAVRAAAQADSGSGGGLLKSVEDCLVEAGFAVSLSNDITSDVWNKLIMNVIINPLTAYYGIHNGELLQSPFLLRMMRMLYDEAIQVAQASGARVAPDLWETVIEVCERTAGNRSSMLQDLDAGRATEIEWLNGSLLAYAEQAGLQLPAHEWIVGAIRASGQSR